MSADGFAFEWEKAINASDAVRLEQLTRRSEGESVNLVNFQGKLGRTALMVAARSGAMELLSWLLQHGADTNLRNHTGGTALMFAALANQSALVKPLLKAGSDLDAQSVNGWSAVMIAAAKGHTDVLAELIEQGARTEAPDIYHWTPLMRAVNNRHAGAALMLLALDGTNPNHQDEAGNTALHCAVMNEDRAMFERLLQAGADPTIRNHRGEPALNGDW